MARSLRFLIAPASRIPSSWQRSPLRTVRPNRPWLVACLLCGVSFTGCSAEEASSPKSGRADAQGAALAAAPVPTHVLTADIDNAIVATEQGDLIEVRLADLGADQGAWRLERQSGDARIEAQGTSLVQDRTGLKRVFRFRALGVGSAELVFSRHAPAVAPTPPEVVTFRISVR
jgi:hypothetical protein